MITAKSGPEQRSLEWAGGSEFLPQTCDGVVEREPFGVQQQARAEGFDFGGGIHVAADDRMAKLATVNAQLVAATGDGTEQQAGPVAGNVPLQHTVVS